MLADELENNKGYEVHKPILLPLLLYPILLPFLVYLGYQQYWRYNRVLCTNFPIHVAFMSLAPALCFLLFCVYIGESEGNATASVGGIVGGVTAWALDFSIF